MGHSGGISVQPLLRWFPMKIHGHTVDGRTPFRTEETLMGVAQNEQEGQTAGFGPCFHLPGQPILGNSGFLSHGLLTNFHGQEKLDLKREIRETQLENEGQVKMLIQAGRWG